MTYLINPKPRSDHPGIMTVERLFVRFADVHRTKRTTTIPGFGPIREVEKVGENEQILRIAAPEPRTDAGTKGNANNSVMHIKRSVTELRKHVRRLRVDDAKRLVDMDLEIENMRLLIRELRQARADFIKQAWKHGQDVPLAEVVDLIPERTNG